MLATALALAGHGFAVFPCRPRSKIPALPNGFKGASKDPKVIRNWWTGNPSLNVAVATGEMSGVFAVDLDGPEGRAELEKLERQFDWLPETLTVCTASGGHFYFRWPGKAVPCSTGKIAPSIDVRGDGGYCLVPPSLHPSGKHYTWSANSGAIIATAPDWLLDRAIGNGATKQITSPEEWRVLAESNVPEGRRDCTLARIAGHLLRKDVNAFVALSLVGGWNATHCVPPLPQRDVVRIVNSVAGLEMRKRFHEGR